MGSHARDEQHLGITGLTSGSRVALDVGRRHKREEAI